MNALDEVLWFYRENVGVKTERGNEIHRQACIDLANYITENERLEKAVDEGCELLKAFYKVTYTEDTLLRTAALLKEYGKE